MIQRNGRDGDDEITRPTKTESGDGRSDTPTHPERMPTAATRAVGPRVLVIDNAEVPRRAMADVLAMAGCEVLQLASAIGATRMILQHKVQAAVIDVAMPGLSGDKLITLLRDNPRLRELAIIVVSARSQQELEAIRSATGADAALDKAVVATELWPTLQRVLARSGPSATP